MVDDFVIYLPQSELDIAFLGIVTAFFYLTVAFITRFVRHRMGWPIHSSAAFYAGLPMNSFHFATAAIIISLVASPNYKDLLIDFRMLLLLAGLAYLISTIGWLVYASRE
jgi:hypothetical protein